ncbi:MAG: hypothetical protein ACE5HE_07105 [Phycisphaerae bacterium]
MAASAVPCTRHYYGPLAAAGAMAWLAPAAATMAQQQTSRSLSELLRYGPGTTNHPVHVRPTEAISIPEGWPVDRDGSITCLTCHPTLPSLAGTDRVLLRDFDGSTDGGMVDHVRFCMKCHGDGEGRTPRAIHWRAMPAAHIKMPPPGDERRGRLDSSSRWCLECHDGVTARESRTTLGASIISGAWDAGRSHPVGVPYPAALSDHNYRDNDSGYVPRQMLPPQVQLPGGSVSCVSCHNLYAGGRYLLTVPIEESALCFTCHSMK